ncbi:MAG: metal-dependent transcriptional regulator [Candidatus Saliniplasma sp.]
MKKKTMEEYIEKIYVIEKRNGRARTGVIALEMGIKDSSVTEMMQKLEDKGLVEYKPYHGVTLTDSGQTIADELMKRHDVIADFLEIIGVKRDLAEIDACQIEHHVSTKTMDRLEKFVEFINDAPQDPRWIEHFDHYVETGERVECNFYEMDSKNE